jgi:hypothetical protein
MITKPVSLAELSKRVDELEAQQTTLLEALKMLLPIAMAIPASTQDSAQAIKELQAALKAFEGMQPRSEDFWYLASAMLLLLSSKAARQHPDDQEVQEIHHGIRAHRMQ